MTPSPITTSSRIAASCHPASQSIKSFYTSCIRSISGRSNNVPLSPNTTVRIKSSPLLLTTTNTTTTETLTTSHITPPSHQQIRWHGGPKVAHDTPTITLTFTNPRPSEPSCGPITCQARVGETLLQTAQRNDIDLEGACEGVCACSTCHVVLQDDAFDSMVDDITDDEEDMLDMAQGLTETSRLGCQVVVGEGMDGWVIDVPMATRNFYVDGHIPQPH